MIADKCITMQDDSKVEHYVIELEKIAWIMIWGYREAILTACFFFSYSFYFSYGSCFDFTQQQREQSFDMIIPRASMASAANSGSSTPSTHTEHGNTSRLQTSVGQPSAPPPTLLLFFTVLIISCCPPDAFLFFVSEHVALSAPAVSMATSSAVWPWITSLSGFFFLTLSYLFFQRLVSHTCSVQCSTHIFVPWSNRRNNSSKKRHWLRIICLLWGCLKN